MLARKAAVHPLSLGLAAALVVVASAAGGFLAGKRFAVGPPRDTKKPPATIVAETPTAVSDDAPIERDKCVEPDPSALTPALEAEYLAAGQLDFLEDRAKDLRDKPSAKAARELVSAALFFSDSYKQAMDLYKRAAGVASALYSDAENHIWIDSWLACIRLRDLGVQVDTEEFLDAAIGLRRHRNGLPENLLVGKPGPKPRFRQFCQAYQEARLSGLSHEAAVKQLHESGRF